MFFIFFCLLFNSYYDNLPYELSRLLSSLHSLEKLINIIVNFEVDLSGTLRKSSVGVRGFIYSFGLKEFLNSFILGLGFGGIETKLFLSGYYVQSFHFFFLQLLIDIGIFAFVFFIYFYLRLVFILRSISFKSKTVEIRYFAKSTSLGLILAIPASVAPSGIHYLLPFYVLIGFGISIVKVNRLINNKIN